MYNCELCQLKDIQKYKCLLNFIIEYLKPRISFQTNKYHLIEIVTWNHIIKDKLFALDRNAWNRTFSQSAGAVEYTDYNSAEG